MNNREYNILKNFMRSRTDYAAARTNRFIAMDLADPAIDFQSLARSMGLPPGSRGLATLPAPSKLASPRAGPT